MHEFRTLLTKFLRENHWTQQKLAGQLDADQATVSRWLSGRVQMGTTTLEKLLTLVPAGQKGVLLEAFLRDQIPQGCDHLIELKPAGASAEALKPKPPGEPEFPKTMDPDLRRRLVFMANLAMNSPDVRKLVDIVFKLANKGKH